MAILLLCAAGANADAPPLHAKSNASAPPASKAHVLHVGEPVKDEYLVFLVERDRHEIPALAASLAHAHFGRLIRIWNDGVQGFWVSMNAMEAEALLHNPNVRSVEENAIVHDSGSQAVGGGDPFWHLDRIDQRSPSLDNSFQYCTGATQVYAYVFDTGVRAADPQFGARVIPGFKASPADSVCLTNTASGQPPPYTDGADFNETNPCGEHNVLNAGHGTSVATLLAGASVGVSKTTIVLPIRIRNCQGVQNADVLGEPASSASMISGLNWLMSGSNPLWDSANHRSLYPAVANFSVFFTVPVPGRRESEAERLIQQLIRGGVVVVASANNQGLQDESLRMAPARLSFSNPRIWDEDGQPMFAGPERVITVGGTMLTNGADQRWVCPGYPNPPCRALEPGSNFGVGVDIWGPARDIQSGNLASLPPGPGDPWTGSQYRRPFTFGAADRSPVSCGQTSTENSPIDYARSGTSWSAPIVAGAAARLLAEDPSLFNDPSTAAATVWSRLRASATHLDAVAANLGTGSPNLFLYIGGVNFKTQPQSSTVAAGGSATLVMEAVGTGLSYQLYAGHYANGVAVGNLQSSGTFTFTPSATQTYWVRASRTCPADNPPTTPVTGDSAEATITVLCTPPAITTQPSSTTIGTGQSATLSVTASGTAPLSYQWYTGSSGNTGSPVGGATSSSVTVSPATTTTYWVRVTNSCGTADSATVTVNTPSAATLLYLVTPCRIIDTRDANGPQGGPALVSGGTRNITVTGVCGIPTGVVAISINIAVVSPSAGGYLTLFTGPAGTSLPLASTISYQTNRTLANNAIVRAGSDTINVFNGGPTVHFVIDVNGYFK